MAPDRQSQARSSVTKLPKRTVAYNTRGEKLGYECPSCRREIKARGDCPYCGQRMKGVVADARDWGIGR